AVDRSLHHDFGCGLQRRALLGRRQLVARGLHQRRRRRRLDLGGGRRLGFVLEPVVLRAREVHGADVRALLRGERRRAEGEEREASPQNQRSVSFTATSVTVNGGIESPRSARSVVYEAGAAGSDGTGDQSASEAAPRSEPAIAFTASRASRSACVA